MNITDMLLNIIIFKYFIGDFIYKASLKFFIRIKNLTKPLQIF